MYVIRLKTIIFFAVIFIASLILSVVGIKYLGGGAPQIISAAADEPNAVELPIIMYHGLTKNPSKVNAYVISVDGFENDLKYLKDNGYTAVFMSDVIKYVNGEGGLPEKPVVLTFDDGFENNYEYGLPLFEKYDMRGLVSIVGSYTENYSKISDENPEYAYLNYDTINKMKDSGRFEFANHSYNMHMLPGMKGNDDRRKGAAKVSGESDDIYRAKLTEDVVKTQNLLSEHCGLTPEVYTYPYGEISKTAEDVLRGMGFKASLSCLEKENYISPGNPDCLFCLCRYLRDNKRSVADILSGN